MLGTAEAGVFRMQRCCYRRGNARSVAAPSSLVRIACGHEWAFCACPAPAVLAAGGGRGAVPGLCASLSSDADALASHRGGAYCPLRPVHGNIRGAGAGRSGDGMGPQPVAPLRAVVSIRAAGGARDDGAGLGRAARGAVAECAAEPRPHGAAVWGRGGELRDAPTPTSGGSGDEIGGCSGVAWVRRGVCGGGFASGRLPEGCRADAPLPRSFVALCCL